MGRIVSVWEAGAVEVSGISLAVMLLKLNRTFVSILSACAWVVALHAGGNPSPSEYALIEPVGAGKASDGSFFPMEAAFDGSGVAWDVEAGRPSLEGSGAEAPYYAGRVGYVDFGPDFAEVHILEAWTFYKAWSGGAQSGFAELWWDDDTDSTNE